LLCLKCRAYAVQRVVNRAPRDRQSDNETNPEELPEHRENSRFLLAVQPVPSVHQKVHRFR
jgi:hypothetical protein